MECTTHPGTTAAGRCSVCTRASCRPCLGYEVDGNVACQACGALENDRSRALGSALLAFIGAGYLATLAIAYRVFHARPFVGGLAAVVAIALGRVLQVYVRLPVVTRTPTER